MVVYARVAEVVVGHAEVGGIGLAIGIGSGPDCFFIGPLVDRHSPMSILSISFENHLCIYSRNGFTPRLGDDIQNVRR